MTLDEMSALAHALVAAEADVARMESDLARLKERARSLREDTIPDAMHELGLEKIKLTSGEQLSIKQEVYASIPSECRHRAFDWLMEHGFGDLIKVDVVAEYRRGDREAALELYHQLQSSLSNAALTFKEDVHNQTLRAFLREQLAAGAAIPLDLFGARPVWTTKILNSKT